MRYALSLTALLLIACKKDPEVQPVKETPAPVAAASKTVAAGKKRFKVNDVGMVSVVIDAPLEKFKGETKKLSGVFDIDPANITASTGEVVADLDAFVTHTFEDNDKNESQTEHARNWFEIGAKVDPKKRDDYRMVRFTIEKIEKSSASSFAEAKDGTFTVTANGTLRVHGRDSKKTVTVAVSFKGPPDAPTEITFKTSEALVASLSEHDVKPRDLTGRFLAGALEKVGNKIDDRAQVQIEGKAVPNG